MLKIVPATVLLLGTAWYQMSGGADFQPGDRGVQWIAAYEAPATQPATGEAAVPVQAQKVAALQVGKKAEIRNIVDTSAKGIQMPEGVKVVKAAMGTAPEPDRSTAVTAARAALTGEQPPLQTKPREAAATRTPVISTQSRGFLHENSANVIITPVKFGAWGEGIIEAAPALSQPVAEYRTITGNGVNLRSGPGTASGVVTQLFLGDRVTVLETRGSWSRLRTADGTTEGWMASRFVGDK